MLSFHKAISRAMSRHIYDMYSLSPHSYIYKQKKIPLLVGACIIWISVYNLIKELFP